MVRACGRLFSPLVPSLLERVAEVLQRNNSFVIHDGAMVVVRSGRRLLSSR